MIGQLQRSDSTGFRFVSGDQSRSCRLIATCMVIASPGDGAYSARCWDAYIAHWAANRHVMPIVATRIESSTATVDRALTMEQESKGRGLSLDQITDGTSSTILVGSVAERFRPWGHPANVRDPALGINRIESADHRAGPVRCS